MDPDAKLWCLNALPGSDSSSRLISKWFNTCKNSHKECHKTQTSFCPTRLIKIEQNEGRRVLRLSEKSSVEDAVDYAALSYCWGENQNVTTVTSTRKRHLLGINITDLPLTIQHAIVVAEGLGLCYLWVE